MGRTLHELLHPRCDAALPDGQLVPDEAAADVLAYTAHIASPEFKRYCDAEEARLRAAIKRKRSGASKADDEIV